MTRLTGALHGMFDIEGILGQTDDDVLLMGNDGQTKYMYNVAVMRTGSEEYQFSKILNKSFSFHL